MKKDDFQTFQIVPSIRKLNHLEFALKSNRKFCLLTEADIVNLKPLVEALHQAGKEAWVNLELLGGFGRDQVGIKLLKNYYKVDGIMTVDSMRISMAKKYGFTTIQRFLLSDSRALDTSLHVLQNSKCDAAEILPAALGCELYPSLRKVTAIPLLAGGFIHSQKSIDMLMETGYNGVTVSQKDLW